MTGYGRGTAADQPFSDSRQWHPWYPLTPRERQIAALTCKGLSNREIALRLYISPATVARHVQNIYLKVGVRSRVELVNAVAKVEVPEAWTGLDSGHAQDSAFISPEQVGDLAGYPLKPDPLTAQTLAELEDLLRALWAWAGRPSSRRLSAHSGRAFSHATISKLIYDKPGKPVLKLEYVLGLVCACGGGEDEQKRWTAAWRRIIGKSFSTLAPQPADE